VTTFLLCNFLNKKYSNISSVILQPHYVGTLTHSDIDGSVHDFVTSGGIDVLQMSACHITPYQIEQGIKLSTKSS